MSRASLPVTNPTPDATLSGVVAIFDPPMCCPTGLCGPGVDPALLELARDLRWLEARGVTVERHGLSQEPDVFLQQPRVAGLLQAYGDRALPATLVKGEVLMHGRYPSRSELLEALAGSPASESGQPAKSSGCTPGSGCC